jgi:Protein of unknown function (DUF3050)
MYTDEVLSLNSEIEPLRRQLLNHPVYRAVNSLRRLQLFTEQHVFAVWDFMSLLKALQRTQTCVTVPWLPKGNRRIARFVNEITLGEESDEDGLGGYASHFEIYLEAMKQLGASTVAINSFISLVERNGDVKQALTGCGAESGAIQFVQTTWSIVNSEKPHCIAAAFSIGREDVIPDMFRQFVDSLEAQSPGRFDRIRYYLERHIEVDEGSHGPMALETIRELCGNNSTLWRESTYAARAALTARIRLWDSVLIAFGQAHPTNSPIIQGVGSI